MDLWLPLLFALSILAFLLTLYPFSQTYIRHYRRDRFRYPISIGILSGFADPSDTQECRVNLGAASDTDWYNHFSSLDSFRPQIISSSEISDRFAIILNPFGELYPEEDIARRESFNRIKSYIANGGIFVNTSGLAFYYMWDSKIGSSFITGEPLEATIYDPNLGLIPMVNPIQTNFLHSWLRENFGVRTTIGNATQIQVYQTDNDRNIVGDITNIGNTNLILEFRSVSYAPNIIPMLRALRNGNEECYPLAAIRYRLGYLVTYGSKPDHAGWFPKLSLAIKNFSDCVARDGQIQ